MLARQHSLAFDQKKKIALHFVRIQLLDDFLLRAGAECRRSVDTRALFFFMLAAWAEKYRRAERRAQ